MEPSALAKTNSPLDFWSLVENRSRSEQVSLAATALAGKIAQKGITDEHQAFIQKLSKRFSPPEMKSMQELLRNNPMMKMRHSSEVDGMLNQLQQIWNGSEVQKSPNPMVNPAVDNGLFSPDALYFRTSFFQKNRGGEFRKAVSVSL